MRLPYLCFWEWVWFEMRWPLFPPNGSWFRQIIWVPPKGTAGAPFLTAGTLCATFMPWPRERKSPLCPPENAGSRQALPRGNCYFSANTPQAGGDCRKEPQVPSATPTPKDSPALPFGPSSRPHTATVTHTNGDELLAWEMVGGPSCHGFGKYFYYRKVLML